MGLVGLNYIFLRLCNTVSDQHLFFLKAISYDVFNQSSMADNFEQDSNFATEQLKLALQVNLDGCVEFDKLQIKLHGWENLYNFIKMPLKVSEFLVMAGIFSTTHFDFMLNINHASQIASQL